MIYQHLYPYRQYNYLILKLKIFLLCKDTDDFIIENNIVKGATIDYGVQNQTIGQILLDIFHKHGDYIGWVMMTFTYLTLFTYLRIMNY